MLYEILLSPSITENRKKGEYVSHFQIVDEEYSKIYPGASFPSHHVVGLPFCFRKLLDTQHRMAGICTDALRSRPMVSQNSLHIFSGSSQRRLRGNSGVSFALSWPSIL